MPDEAPIIDIGGGASGLAGELLALGHSDLTVTDISEAALEVASDSMGVQAASITWISADVRNHDFQRRFAVWHDRAVFHFMTDPADRSAYLDSLRRNLLPGGHLILATFGPQGPTRCSGLPILRYDPKALAQAFDGVARIRSSHLEDHETPSGKTQQFLYAHLEAV